MDNIMKNKILWFINLYMSICIIINVSLHTQFFYFLLILPSPLFYESELIEQLIIN